MTARRTEKAKVRTGERPDRTRRTKRNRTVFPGREKRGKGNQPCQLEHVQPEPRIENYVEVWPPQRLISFTKYKQIVKEQLRDAGLLTTGFKYYYGDKHTWAVDHDVAWFISEHGKARSMLSSGTVVVPYPEDLEPGTEIIETLSDGSVVINGEGGDCDSQASVLHSDFITFANQEMLGFEFACGFLWKTGESGKGHSPCFIIDTAEQLWFMEPKRPQETFLLEPSGKINLLYN
jgi:hypothetical protein